MTRNNQELADISAVLKVCNKGASVDDSDE